MEKFKFDTLGSIRGTKSLLAAFLCIATVTACDADAEPSEADDVLAHSEELEVVEHDEIAEVLADEDTTITFTREQFGDDPEAFVVGMKIVGLDDGVAYEKLIADQGLSPLEVFFAFAPEGAEAPEELFVSHEATALAQKRDTDDLRELTMPRSVYVLNSVYCDSYALFTGYINSIWTNHGDNNSRAISKSSYSHSLQKNDWHSAAANACNFDNEADIKDVYMCARPRVQTRTWSCEMVSLGNGLRATKVWFPVYNGSEYYEQFDYKIFAEPTGEYVMSYLGLNVAIWGPL